MGDWPDQQGMAQLAGEALSPLSQLSIGGIINTVIAGAAASTAWPAANRALFIPFRLPRPYLVTQAVVGCGSTGGNNFDVGVYDAFGNRLVSSGATARGTTAEVVANLTDTMLGPGNYYMGLASDSAGTFIALAPAQVGLVKMCGIKQMASAYVLPATATYATAASAFIPLLAIYGTPL